AAAARGGCAGGCPLGGTDTAPAGNRLARRPQGRERRPLDRWLRPFGFGTCRHHRRLADVFRRGLERASRPRGGASERNVSDTHEDRDRRNHQYPQGRATMSAPKAHSMAGRALALGALGLLAAVLWIGAVGPIKRQYDDNNQAITDRIHLLAG